MDFLKQFENKFIPFNVTVDVETSAPYDEPNIYFDVIDSPIPLKTKDPKKYTFDGVSVDAIFDVVTLDGKNVAEVHLYLNFFRNVTNIINKDTTYYSSDGLQLHHSEDMSRLAVIPNESYTFRKTTEKGVDELQITQVGNNLVYDNVVGAYVSHSEKNSPNNFSKKISSSLFTKPNNIEDILVFPYKTQGLDSTLLKYQALKTRFKKGCVLGLDCSDKEYEQKLKSYTDLSSHLSSDKKHQISKNVGINSSLKNLAIYLSDPNNDLLRGFKGNYVGSILCESLDESIDTPSPLIVVTEQEKSGNTYRCYYLLENSDVETIRKTNQELKKDPKKYLKYVTQIGENEEEELAFYNGKQFSKLTPEEMAEAKTSYTKFVEEFLTPFSSVQPVNIEQFIQEPRDLSDGQR